MAVMFPTNAKMGRACPSCGNPSGVYVDRHGEHCVVCGWHEGDRPAPDPDGGLPGVFG